MVHVHYDKDAILARFDEGLATHRRALQQAGKPDMMIDFEVRSQSLSRAMLDLVVEAKMAGYDHATIGRVCGGALASATMMVLRNYRCDCVLPTILDNFTHNLERMIDGRAAVTDQFVAKGDTGGRA